MNTVIGLDNFKDVVGYEGLYAVSKTGVVVSVARVVQRVGAKGALPIKERVLATGTWLGYTQVNLWRDGKYKTMKVHRLVASAFIPNPENKRDVNHINGAKHDNRVENLEWATVIENQRHSWDVLKRKHWNTGLRGQESPKTRLIHKYNVSGELVDSIYGLESAANTVNGSKYSLCVSMKNRMMFKGFVFVYN
jgi:hypothetical protein